MTIPREERWALLNTHKWLREFALMNLSEIRNNPRKIRSEAIALLKHWPFDCNINDIWDKREKDWEDNL